MQRLEAIRDKFYAKMSDDFNTPDAITAMFELVHEANSAMASPSVSPALLRRMDGLFQEMDGILGILPAETEELLDEEIEKLIQERTEARKAKNFQRADEIRDLLNERGIVLEDTPQGVRWKRK